MNAIELMQRAEALGMRIRSAKTVEESESFLNALKRLYDRQCVTCGSTDDDPAHQPKPRRWRKPKAPSCSYTPRVPEHMWTPELDDLTAWGSSPSEQGDQS